MPGKDYFAHIKAEHGSSLLHQAGGRVEKVRLILADFYKQAKAMTSPTKNDVIKLIKEFAAKVESAKTLTHWGIKMPFDESKVVRSAKGRFASAADAVSDTATDAFDSTVEFAGGLSLDDATNAVLGASDTVGSLLSLVGNPFSVKVVEGPSTVPMDNTFEFDSTDSDPSNDVPTDNWFTGFFKHSDLEAFEVYEVGDKLDYGIRGMKWGIRRTDRQISKDTAKRKSSGEKVTPTEKSKSVTELHKVGEAESAASRYARLTSEAKGGGAKSWNEADLKFYNSRTEALSKVNKMFSQNPSWLAATSKKVLQQAAQNTMQSVADGVAKKYITTPILDSIPEPKKK